MRNFSRPINIKVDEENPYWISFSDLMSALLIIFILTAVALIIELTEIQKKVKEDISQLRHAEQARKDILIEIKNELAKKKIHVVIAENETILRIPEETLSFESNSYEIPTNENLRKSIVVIGLALHKAINKAFDNTKSHIKRFEYLDTIFIEGHTDSRPSSRIKGNWGLSSYRAISLWDFWSEKLAISPPLSEMKNAFKQNLFSVSGYAASRRLSLSETTSEERAKNRRIDIRFTIKKPSISQLEDIAEQ